MGDDPTGLRAMFQECATGRPDCAGNARKTSASTLRARLSLTSRDVPSNRAAAFAGCARRRRIARIGADHLLDERVAHHVDLAEAAESDAFDVAQDLAGVDQAGSAADRQIDLGNIAGDHRLAVEAEPGEKHL